LAAGHEHLVVHGVTGDAARAVRVRDRIHRDGLTDRAEVFRAGPLEPYPGTYDLVVGLGVVFRERDKRQLVANLDTALVDGGRVLLADYVCALRGDLDDRAAGTSVSTVDSWVALLGHGRLLVELVEPAPSVLDDLLADASQAEPLRRGWTHRVLLLARKDVSAAAEDRDAANRRALTDCAGRPARTVA
jgi:polyketide synthase 12